MQPFTVVMTLALFHYSPGHDPGPHAQCSLRQDSESDMGWSLPEEQARCQIRKSAIMVALSMLEGEHSVLSLLEGDHGGAVHARR